VPKRYAAGLPLIRSISANAAAGIAFSCAYSENIRHLCARCVRESSREHARDVDSSSGAPKDRNRFQGIHRFSPNPNKYNNLGNLLFARQSTQDTSTDRVRAQFCHSASHKRSNCQRARYQVSAVSWALIFVGIYRYTRPTRGFLSRTYRSTSLSKYRWQTAPIRISPSFPRDSGTTCSSLRMARPTNS
jgi:hypothetical protein